MQLLIAGVVFTLVAAVLVVYGLRVEYAGRCSRCGRGFIGGRAPLWCLNGHKIHEACAAHLMGRDACPICGRNVSDFRG